VSRRRQRKREEVWMIGPRDHMVRRIYLTGRHSETVKPSWFGESISGRKSGYDSGEIRRRACEEFCSSTCRGMPLLPPGGEG
jgi:hypothetical protein